jgi:hypothetical protein
VAGELSFLEVNGEELANAARTTSYLQRGLQPMLDLGQVGVCSVLAAELGVGQGIAPEVDPAPWYDAAVPHSKDFLGLLILDLPVDVRATRTAVSRIGGRGGSAIGTEERAGATMSLNGVLVARSTAGLAYGRDWVKARLGQDPCNPCALSTLRYREFCPPVGSTLDVGEWLLYDAGVTGDGVQRGDGDPQGAWEMLSALLTSSHDARFRPPTVALPASTLAPVQFETDVIDFSTDPFADGRLAKIPYLGSNPPVTLLGGHLMAPSSTNGFITFYRAGKTMLDGSIVLAFKTGPDIGFSGVELLARWRNPTVLDSAGTNLAVKFNVVPVSPTNTTGVTLAISEVSIGASGETQLADGYQATSAPFNVDRNGPTGLGVEYWIRATLDRGNASMEVWDVDPYPVSDGPVRTDHAPIAATTPPTHAMTLDGSEQPGTWGVVTYGGFGVGTPDNRFQYLDDLEFHASCMSFDRWFCEAPAAAAQGVELAPSLPGATVSAIVTLDATSGQIANAYVEARHGGCDEAGDVFARIRVPLVVAGSVLVIDSARQKITYTDPDGTILDGFALVELDEGENVQWIDAPECNSPICVTAGVAAWCGTHENATITIERHERV